MTLSEKIIISASQQLPKSEVEFNTLKRYFASQHGIRKSGLSGYPDQMPSKTELLTAYHKLLKSKSIAKNKGLEKLLMRRAVRSLSGVTIVTSLVKPYPCPGLCVYCPLDERMPKSYLADEPAAMRALRLKFDPYDQMAKRIEALEANGHPADKIELIIKGGTWNSYPLGYQYWFVLRSFEAANEIGCQTHNAKRVTRREPSNQTLRVMRYALNNPHLTETSPLDELRTELFRQQRLNEKAKHRIIGLTLETRPDCITEKSIWQMREMGCTRLELGVQHTDDAILALTKRGHDSARAKAATKLLKDYGFKTDFHLMPQLPGATPESDLRMLEEIFDNPCYRPDMIKIYPCTVVKGSELYDWFVQGKYKAYPVDELIRLLKIFKTKIPRWCRISRLIRDIPGQYIEEGNKITNLRQVIQEQMRQEGLCCNCLRCREIGHAVPSPYEGEGRVRSRRWPEPRLFVDTYEASEGTEYFLSFEDAKRRMVFAFCRLRICSRPPLGPLLFERRGGASHSPSQRGGGREGVSPLSQLAAFIRELHTYGQLVGIGKQKPDASQHKGLGKKLVQEAERIARKREADTIAVISGVGVRDYYRKLGYRLQKTYMVKRLAPVSNP